MRWIALIALCLSGCGTVTASRYYLQDANGPRIKTHYRYRHNPDKLREILHSYRWLR